MLAESFSAKLRKTKVILSKRRVQDSFFGTKLSLHLASGEVKVEESRQKSGDIFREFGREAFPLIVARVTPALRLPGVITYISFGKAIVFLVLQIS